MKQGWIGQIVIVLAAIALLIVREFMRVARPRNDQARTAKLAVPLTIIAFGVVALRVMEMT